MIRPADFIDRLMDDMTLAEKIGQLNLATPGGETLTGATVNTDVAAKIRDGRIGAVFGVKSAEAVRMFQDLAMQSRLAIPLMFAEDVIHGQKTIFPLPLALAASWNMDLVEATARIAAVEASSIGIDQAYAPMVDICRDPRWGRIAESPGEDPFLAARYAEAMVRGFQGDDLTRPDAVMACLKHYVGYGGAMGGRDYDGVDLGPITLHDVYLPPFAAGVRAGAGSVMAAFNALDGTPMHANRLMIEEVLRRRLGFSGLVVADYTGVAELVNHRVAADDAEAARLALAAGVDMDMVSEAYLKSLADEIAAGRLDPALVDAACRRVLEAKRALGLFDDPYRRVDWGRATQQVLTPPHRALARRAVAESMVLLKNRDGALPLPRRGRVALIGPFVGDRVNMNGTWAVAGSPASVVTIADGIAAVAGPAVEVVTAKGANIVDDPELAARLNVHDWGDLSVVIDDRTPDEMIAEAVSVAAGADRIVAVVGEAREYSGESSSRIDLLVPEPQKRLLRALAATGKPLVVVVMTGRPLALAEESRLADALLVAWFGGTEIGNGLADLLFGDLSPSGRLPATFPYAVGQVPVTYAHAPTGRPFPGSFRKFTSGYIDMPDDVPHNDGLYPFGFGLGYSSVDYAPPVVERAGPGAGGAVVAVTITVTNTGSRPVDEVVQLYVSGARAPVSRPVKELKGFQKVHLAAGERRDVTFALTAEDLAYSTATALDDTGRSWPGGAIDILAGPSSRDLAAVRIDWQHAAS